MSKFDNKLRGALQKHVQNTDDPFYRVAKDAMIPESVLYNFKNNVNSGLNGENTVKLMNHLNITLEELK